MLTVTPPQFSTRRDLLVWLALLLVVLITLTTFLPVLDGQFLNWDDDKSVVGNVGIRGVGGSELHWMFTTALLGHYAPLTWLSFALTYMLAGLDPRAYHSGTLALHALNAGLLLLVARRLFRAAWGETRRTPTLVAGAAVAALAWSIHPLRAENVGWISDRGDVQCGTFYLLAVLGYLRAVSNGESLRWRWAGVASLVAYAAALLCKEVAITLPATLLLIDVYPLRRLGREWRWLLAEKAPYAILALAGAVSAMIARSSVGGWTPYQSHGLGARLGFAAFSLWFYPWKTLWPFGLSPLYALPAADNLPRWSFIAAALGVAVVTAVVIVVARRRPAGLAVWTYGAVAVAPVSGLTHAGVQLVADRYSYLPGLGLALLVGGGVVRLLYRSERSRRNISRRNIWQLCLLTGVLLTLVAWGVLSWRQSGYWRTAVVMWQRAVDVDPGCVMCNAKLGEALLTANRPREAEAPLREAVTRAPASVTPHLNLAISLAMQGREVEAEAELRAARRLAPESLGVTKNLAVLYARQGRLADAVDLLREAAKRSPDLPEVHVELGLALERLGVQRAREGRLTAAVAALRESATILNTAPSVLTNLGHVLVDQQRTAEAIPILERAVALDPRSAPARIWLIRAYRREGQPLRAAHHVSALETLDPAKAAALRR